MTNTTAAKAAKNEAEEVKHDEEGKRKYGSKITKVRTGLFFTCQLICDN